MQRVTETHEDAIRVQRGRAQRFETMVADLQAEAVSLLTK